MWAGLYGYNTIDNLPYVFAENGLVVVGGDSGSGVMKGDSLGRVVDAVYRGGEGAEAELVRRDQVQGLEDRVQGARRRAGRVADLGVTVCVHFSLHLAFVSDM